MSILDLKPGEHGIIQSVGAAASIRQRLLDMGLLPRASVKMERLAPTGDPVWIRLEQFQLSLRRSEAGSVAILPAQ